MEQNFTLFCRQFLELKEAEIPLVVVTLTQIIGHAPQDVGARMIVGLDQVHFGTVGGGKVEKKCIDYARELLQKEDALKYDFKTWNLPQDIGMTCGGEVSFFFEVHKPSESWDVVLFGAGHIGQELTRVLLRLDCNLTVIDPRAEWLERLPTHPRLKKILQEDMPLEVKNLKPHSFVAVITMGHPTDYPICKEALLKQNFPYLGVIGSKVKRVKINADLKNEGIAKDKIESFFCPMGEDLGKNTPPEIAISIVSQMLKVRDQLNSRKSKR